MAGYGGLPVTSTSHRTGHVCTGADGAARINAPGAGKLAQRVNGLAAEHAVPTVPGNLKTALELLPQYEAMDAQVVRHGALHAQSDTRRSGGRLLSDSLRSHCASLMPYNTQDGRPNFSRLADIDRIIGVRILFGAP